MNAMQRCILVVVISILVPMGIGPAWSQDSSESDRALVTSGNVSKTQKKSKSDSKAENDDVPSPKEIINRHVELIGGHEAIESIESLHQKATAEHASGTQNSEFESFLKPGLFYAETYTYPMTGRVFGRGVRDGVGWEGYHGQGVRVYHGEELKGYLFRASRPFWCTRWIDDCKSIKFVGVDEVKDKKAYVLRMEFKNGFKFDNYFEVESGLCVRTVSKEFFHGKESETVSTILESERVDGILMAKKLEIIRSGSPIVYTYTELEVDCEIPNSYFDYPDGLDKEKAVELQKAQEKAQREREAIMEALKKAKIGQSKDGPFELRKPEK